MSQEDPQVQARIKEILARRATSGTGTSAAMGKPSGVEAAKPSTDPRVQEILAQRTMVGAGNPAAMVKPGGVEAAKPSAEPRVQEILGRRTMVGAGNPAATGKPGGVEAAKPSAEPRAITQVDLKNIENHMMFSIAALGQANNGLAKVEKELQILNMLFKVVLGVGSVGVVVGICGVLRLTGHFFN